MCSKLVLLVAVISSLHSLGDHFVNAELPTLTIIIRSQPNSYHEKKAAALQLDLKQQIDKHDLKGINVIQMHKKWPDYIDKAWAVIPLMHKLLKSAAVNRDWVMFVEDGTIVNLEKLVKLLLKYDPNEDLLLARGLFDNDMTIIHHFHFQAKGKEPFLFPDFEAGWLLSSTFVKKIGKDWGKDTAQDQVDFQIDLKHELAMYVNSTYGVKVTHVPEFCGAGEEGEKCVTNVMKALPDCGDTITQDDVFVGVKTTLKFHKDRIKAVMQTWGPKVKNMVLYSNVTDTSIPTIDCGVPNTERGHCGKTDAILKDYLKRAEMKKYRWLIIVDDDTIMSVSRMLKVLSCYDASEPVVLGEKYGYGLNSRRGYGYAYITGGGGMVFSTPAAEAWVDGCQCPTDDTPDDMYIGQCLMFRAAIHVTHSPLFHQARPDDYSDGYLGNQLPVSFHKHWMVDPIRVYKTWFAEADSSLPKYPHSVGKGTATTPPPIIIPEPLPPTPLENPIKDEL